jgi:MFS family permease
MSTKSLADASPGETDTRKARHKIAPAIDLRTLRIARFTLGSTAATAIAYAYEWPLFFLTPVLTIVFLSKPIPGFTHRKWNLTAYVVSAMFLGVVFTLFLQPFPLIYVPLLGLALFNIYYLMNRNGPFFFALISLLAVLILPMMGEMHEQLALGFSLYFALSAALAIVLFTVAHVLIPDPPGSPEPPDQRFQPGYSESAARNALKSTLAVLPLAVLFIAFDQQSQLLVVVYAGILSLMADPSAGWASGMKLLLSTLLGGIAAIVIYWLLVAVPEFHFFIILWCTAMWIFGSLIYSEHPLAKYMSSAAIAMTILVSGSLGAGTEFVDKLVIRIALISLATVYVGAALAVIDRYLFKATKVG